MGSEFRPTVFICFHPNDAALVEDLINSLQYDFHIDTNERQPGIGAPKDAIRDTVGNAEFFIFILSKSSCESESCRTAYNIANKHNRKRMKQIRFGFVKASRDYLPVNLPRELTKMEPYDLSTPGSNKYKNMRKKLVNDLCKEVNVIQAIQAVQELEDYADPEQKLQLRRRVAEIERKAASLRDTISVGDIKDSQFIAIGKDIKIVVEEHKHTLPPDKVEQLTHLANRLALPGEYKNGRKPRFEITCVLKLFIMLAVVTAFFTIAAPLALGQPLGLAWLSRSTPTWTPTSLPENTPFRTCSAPGDTGSFSIFPDYDPSGYMGDIGDLTVAKEPEVIRFTYEADGRGPHEFDFKFIQIDGDPTSQLNPRPAQFAGVMYLNPPSNFGTRPNGGLDLRNFSRSITWEARSLTGEVNVEFVIGGVTWIWEDGVKVDAPYPGSMRRTSLGIYTLTSDWGQPFEYDLSDKPEEEFECVVGGFAWVISWGSNGVKLNDEGTGAEEPKTFIIEIRNIEYHGVEP